MGNKTLRSRSTARVLDAISEGPIWGLLNGDKSIFLNGTQLQNSGGGYNFRGVRTNERKGSVGQSIISGFRSVTNEISDGRQIEKGSPITFDVSDDDIDAVALKIRVNSLFKTTNKGKMKPNAVVLEIERQPNGGSFTKVGTVRIKGRSTSAYDRQKRIELPDGGHPYTVRVKRITDNSSDPQEPSDTYLPSYTLITDLRLRYPYTALIGVEVDAQKFGSSFPDRIYNIGGRLIEYPSNYNPNTRVYTGVWDGTFTSGQRCDNPAWVLRDLAIATRYGLGNVLTAASVDKWALYKIAQYCDELIDNGSGGTEPRFRYNGVIETTEEAAKALDRIASVFRGMLYWQSGSVTFTSDAPITSVPINVTPANIINGNFSYGISAKKARHSTVIVAFNNPDKLGETDFEYVTRDHLVLKYGYQPIELGLVGCTSRSQAHRAGEWLLDSEEFETDMVTYTAGLDHAKVRPGDVVAVFDPWYAGARMGGRVLASSTASVTLDAPYDVDIGLTHYIRLTLPDGEVVERAISNAAGPGQTVITFASVGTAPLIGSVYGIANDDINPRMFRVISGTPKEGNKFEINALFYDPTKYDRVERNLTLSAPSYTGYDTNVLQPPSGLNITETRSDNGDDYAVSAVLSWEPADDTRVTRYGVQILDSDDEDYQEEEIVEGTSFSYEECPLGELNFRVRSLPDDNRWAASAYIDATPETIVGYPDPTPYSALTAIGKFRKVVLKFAENTDEKFKRAELFGSNTNDVTTAVRVGCAPLGDIKCVDEGLPKKVTRYYWIAARDKYGRLSAKYPSGTTGISATTVPIDDDDTDDDLATAPTALSIQKVQDKDQEGTIRTYLELDCTFPGWAGDKADAIYEITVAGVSKKFKEIGDNGKAARFRVQKTGVLHSVRARIKSGAGKLSNWTSTGTITPTKKGADSVAITGVTINRKTGENVIRWARITDPDNREVAIYRNTSNSFGGATMIDTTKATKYRDDNVNSKGTTYYYWVLPIDTSDNFGGFASSSVAQVETGLGTSDTDAAVLAAPTSISIFQSNRDINKDGTIETALRSTIGGLVANAAGYECWFENDLGESKTERADSGSFWFPASTQRSYRTRWRTINWVGTPGSWSAYTSYITPAATTGAPGTPSGLSVSALPLGIYAGWTQPTDNDYVYTEVWIGSGSPSIQLATASGGFATLKYYSSFATQVWIRHVNSSGLKSGYSGSSSVTPGKVGVGQLDTNTVGRTQLISGEAAASAKSNLGTSLGGSVNAGPGARTTLIMEWKCTSNTAGVTVNLGSKSQVFDFVDQTPYTMISNENGGGSFSSSKSGGGTLSGAELVAITTY